MRITGAPIVHMMHRHASRKHAASPRYLASRMTTTRTCLHIHLYLHMVCAFSWAKINQKPNPACAQPQNNTTASVQYTPAA